MQRINPDTMARMVPQSPSGPSDLSRCLSASIYADVGISPPQMTLSCVRVHAGGAERAASLLRKSLIPGKQNKVDRSGGKAGSLGP